MSKERKETIWLASLGMVVMVALFTSNCFDEPDLPTEPPLPPPDTVPVDTVPTDTVPPPPDATVTSIVITAMDDTLLINERDTVKWHAFITWSTGHTCCEAVEVVGVGGWKILGDNRNKVDTRRWEQVFDSTYAVLLGSTVPDTLACEALSGELPVQYGGCGVEWNLTPTVEDTTSE